MKLFNNWIKRVFDFIAAFSGLLVFSPFLTAVLIVIWLQDFKSPFYISGRVGKNEKVFRIVKLRSMVTGADKSGVDSTASNDARITVVGHVIRNYKLDELSQLWNVLKGDMSLVGPRPNVQRETDLYTQKEKELLKVKPGITDFASIVFADEGQILSDKENPDLAYNQLIRPGKSELGLFYIQKQSLFLDIIIILITLISIVSREQALILITFVLKKLGASTDLLLVSRRKAPLKPMPPVGADTVVTDRIKKISDHDHRA
jgi:lipopolysaccharide/colanic/teichoic acid biosynthesis glycosyltransferase